MEKLSTLHQDNRKDALTLFQKLPKPTYDRLKGVKVQIHFKDFPEECPGYSAPPRWPNPAMQSEAAPAVVQADLSSSYAGNRVWHYPCDTSLADMQNARTMGSWSFPPKFKKEKKRKTWEARNCVAVSESCKQPLTGWWTELWESKSAAAVEIPRSQLCQQRKNTQLAKSAMTMAMWTAASQTVQTELSQSCEPTPCHGMLWVLDMKT